jgi:hypothetical protein
MAQKKKTFKTIVESRVKRGSLPQDSYKSRKWYRQKTQRMMGVRSIRPRRIIQEIGRQNKRTTTFLKGRIMLGKMFMFEYEAKAAKTLPYYDAFPLIFPFEFTAGGFTGMNLHYLPHEWRAILMDNLYDLRTDDNMDENTRLSLSVSGYNILTKSAKYRYFRPCVRSYLYEQVTSRYMEIPPDEWEIALFLPLERFVGASRRQVWFQTRKEYRRSKWRKT